MRLHTGHATILGIISLIISTNFLLLFPDVVTTLVTFFTTYHNRFIFEQIILIRNYLSTRFQNYNS